MVQVIIFASGYAVGGLSALLLVGLTLVSRRARTRRPSVELMRYDVEHSSL
jgi:hypothetical protein